MTNDVVRFPSPDNPCYSGGLDSASNPNFGELMVDLRLLWERWGREERELRDQDMQSKASTQRVCMEDIERLAEKYGGSVLPKAT